MALHLAEAGLRLGDIDARCGKTHSDRALQKQPTRHVPAGLIAIGQIQQGTPPRLPPALPTAWLT
jgi:hypothetical protein